MRQDKKIFSHLSMQDSKSIEPILTAISKGLARGELKFSDEDDEIVLSPDGLLKLKVTASKTDSIHRLNLKISWYAEEEQISKKKIMAVTSRKAKK